MAQYTELRYFHLPPKLAQQTSLQVININNLISELQLLINTKVDKLYNKQLSQKSFTITDKNTISKSLNQIVDLLNLINSLPDIILSDWNTEDTTDMSYIKNKPDVPILESGLIPERYLPSYVDDIIEGYYYNNAFYKDSAHTQFITGETGKIYVDLSTDLTYRWSGSTYIEISKSVITGVKGDAEANYRIGNVNLTAANIGLGNVVNLDLSKAIKGITRNGLTFTYTCLDGTTGTFTQQDNNTTYSAGTGLQLTNTVFSVKLGYTTSGNNRAVQADANGNLYVTLKDDNTTYSAGTGLSLTNTTFALALTKKLVTDALGYTPPTTDTNTHRPILVNGTQILGDNTTALNLKAGSNVTLTNSSGTVTIASTDTNTWRPLGTGASDACAGNDSRLSNSRPASDVYAWAKASTKPSYDWSEITSKPTIPTKTSQLTNDSGFITGGSFVAKSGDTMTGTLTMSNDKYIVVNRDGRGITFGLNSTNTYIGGDTSSMYMCLGKNLPIIFLTNNTEQVRITNTGTLSVGSTNPATGKLYVNGLTYVEGNVSASTCISRSDLRLKDVQDESKYIDIKDIANAPIITFKWKNTEIDDLVHIGTSAQYWNTVLPESIFKSYDDYLSMDYGATALVSAVTVAREVVEHDKKIKLLEEENKQLKEELLLLKSQINDILTTINKSTNNE